MINCNLIFFQTVQNGAKSHKMIQNIQKVSKQGYFNFKSKYFRALFNFSFISVPVLIPSVHPNENHMEETPSTSAEEAQEESDTTIALPPSSQGKAYISNPAEQ